MHKNGVDSTGVHPSFPKFPQDIKLVVTDMDGTLLNPNGTLFPTFFPVLDELLARGIEFVVASGRQYYNLREMFQSYLDRIYFIAENGSFEAFQDQPLSILEFDKANVRPIAEAVRALENCHAVYCGAKQAYVEDLDAAFLQEVSKYYQRLEIVPDITAVADDPCLKIAVCNLGEAPDYAYPHLRHFEEQGLKVVLSGRNWVDLSDPIANKGVPLKRLQQRLGISPDQTLAFGDQMNDSEMLSCATYSFAVANAFPELFPHARFVAPSNAEHGVIQVLEHLLQNSVEK